MVGDGAHSDLCRDRQSLVRMVAFGSCAVACTTGYLQYHYHDTVSPVVVVWAALSAVGVFALKGAKR